MWLHGKEYSVLQNHVPYLQRAVCDSQARPRHIIQCSLKQRWIPINLLQILFKIDSYFFIQIWTSKAWNSRTADKGGLWNFCCSKRKYVPRRCRADPRFGTVLLLGYIPRGFWNYGHTQSRKFSRARGKLKNRDFTSFWVEISEKLLLKNW